MGLDDRFGAARLPVGVNNAERRFSPRSLQRLDENSARRLRSLFEAAHVPDGLVTATAFDRLPILWVVDEEGSIWLALEEVVLAETGDVAFPLARNFPYFNQLGASGAPPYVRLGHPALLGGRAGRIGGEIMFDRGNKF